MSLPFEQLTIHSLRGLRDLELKGFGRVNLLVGPNDAGKTTVLEALTLCSEPQNPLAWGVIAGAREPNIPSLSEPDLLRWLFPQRAGNRPEQDYTGTVLMSANGAYSARSVQAHYREVRGLRPQALRAGDRVGQPLVSSVEKRGAEIRLEVASQATDAKEVVMGNLSFTVWEGEGFRLEGRELDHRSEFIFPHQHRYTSLAERFSQARLEGFHESVEKLLQALDPRISGLEVLAPHGHPNLYLRDSMAGLAPVSTFGDGIRRALLLASVMPRLSGRVLLIDELETAIHVSVLGKLFRWLLDACKQFNVQLFATTHSLEAVDAILDADTTAEDDIVGYRLARTGEGASAKRYSEDILKLLRHERGLDVR